ncbi:hypothetical protein B0H14DRAFT_2940836, partial [Mycena olivaceomarginata]
MNLASLLRLLGTRSPLGVLLCPALPAVASCCSFPPFSTNRGSSEDITRLNEPMPAIFGRFCGIPPAQCAVVGRGCPRFAPLPALTMGHRRSGVTHMCPCSSPPAVFAAATPSRCASLPARPSSDPAAFCRPRSLPCTVLESRSPGAGTL